MNNSTFHISKQQSYFLSKWIETIKRLEANGKGQQQIRRNISEFEEEKIMNIVVKFDSNLLKLYISIILNSSCKSFWNGLYVVVVVFRFFFIFYTVSEPLNLYSEHCCTLHGEGDQAIFVYINNSICCFS